MRTKIIISILKDMTPYLTLNQRNMLSGILLNSLENVEIIVKDVDFNENHREENNKLLTMLISAKQVEGCSNKL